MSIGIWKRVWSCWLLLKVADSTLLPVFLCRMSWKKILFVYVKEHKERLWFLKLEILNTLLGTTITARVVSSSNISMIIPVALLFMPHCISFEFCLGVFAEIVMSPSNGNNFPAAKHMYLLEIEITLSKSRDSATATPINSKFLTIACFTNSILPITKSFVMLE